MFDKKIYCDIAKYADDTTALNILTTKKSLYANIIYVFNCRYPDLVKYERETFTYLQMLKYIKLLRDEFGFIYHSGNPELYYKLLQKYHQSVEDLLLTSAHKGIFDLVKHLVENFQINVVILEEALHRAIISDNYKIIQYLLSKISIPLSNYSNYYLCLAVKNGRLDIVKYLFEEKKADFSKYKETALILANNYGQILIEEYLKEYIL